VPAHTDAAVGGSFALDIERDLPFWVALHRVHRLGAVRFELLERAFPTMEAAWRASAAELRHAGLDRGSIETLEAERTKADPAVEMERLAQQGVTALAIRQPGYPARLREIPDAPSVIYVKGSLASDDEWSIAVVGTRRVTPYGRQATPEIARELAVNRITVVSGLARGIDTIAHRTALDAGGRTIAVLAAGLDTIYPPENKRMSEEIVERGALVSDYPLDTRPRAEYFPRRNRIMSGLALGTLIVEGDHKSGAMITARFAAEQNREVFAVPGSIFSPQSRGPNALIKDGATPVLGAADVLEALNLTMLGAQIDFGRAVPPASEEEHALLSVLSREPRHIDIVVRESGLAAATVSGTLALLELKGLVRDVGGMQYVRLREDVPPYLTGQPSGAAPEATGPAS